MGVDSWGEGWEARAVEACPLPVTQALVKAAQSGQVTFANYCLRSRRFKTCNKRCFMTSFVSTDPTPQRPQCKTQ